MLVLPWMQARVCLPSCSVCPPTVHPLQVPEVKDVMALQLNLTAEEANKNLHKFRGKAQLVDERFRDMPLSPGASAGTNGTGVW